MMKKIICVFLTLAMVVTAGMTLASCSDSDNDDNPVVIVDPTPGEDGYTIEVGEGMTLPENEFNTKVPATTDFDQDIVNALKAIDKVTDVKPFTMVHVYNLFHHFFTFILLVFRGSPETRGLASMKKSKSGFHLSAVIVRFIVEGGRFFISTSAAFISGVSRVSGFMSR